MKILLDTQVFIWLINEDSLLGAKARELTKSTANQLYISYLSFFEMMIKSSIGKLQFDASVLDDLERIGVHMLSGDKQSLAEYRIFNNKNKDPFDNFLIATAKANDLMLLSSDQAILATSVANLELIDATE